MPPLPPQQIPPPPVLSRDTPSSSGGLRLVWLALGFLCIALGVIGALLPLMPTTIFLILAAGCFARSSPRLEARLLAHPRFGPLVQGWRDTGAIPMRAKIAACAGMALGFGLFVAGVHPRFGVGVFVAGLLAACAGWIVSRPALAAPGR